VAPSFRAGKGAYFSITSATGGTVNLSSGLSDASINRVAKALDVTHFGNNDAAYIAGLRDATIKLSGIFASTYEEKLFPLLGSTSGGAWVYGPESTANTRRKYSGSSVVTNVTIGSPVGDKVSMSIDLQCSGTITSTTF